VAPGRLVPAGRPAAALPGRRARARHEPQAAGALVVQAEVVGRGVDRIPEVGLDRETGRPPPREPILPAVPEDEPPRLRGDRHPAAEPLGVARAGAVAERLEAR